MNRIILLMALLSTPLLRAAQSTPAPKSPKPVQTEKQEDAGTRIFKANCARCHNAPEGFSPRISGTILMHMRVRANLSAEDQKVLLKYLAP
jgi:cytochrome c5